MLQKGVLRTNCIDRLDRTNVAQYAYELIALRHQLQALGFIESLRIDLDNPLEKEVMATCESIRDTLPIQMCGTLILKGNGSPMDSHVVITSFAKGCKINTQGFNKS
jgi:hypothetical protein